MLKPFCFLRIFPIRHDQSIIHCPINVQYESDIICKVFGSERNNKTYYTNCIEELDGIENIANDMKEFRDKYIAHSDFYNKPVPIMEKAVNVIRQFDKAMIAKYGLDNQETT